MTSESSFKAENPDKIVDLASFPVCIFVSVASRVRWGVVRTQREFVGVIVHLGQRVENDPVIEVSFGPGMSQEVQRLTQS